MGSLNLKIFVRAIPEVRAYFTISTRNREMSMPAQVSKGSVRWSVQGWVNGGSKVRKEQ